VLLRTVHSDIRTTTTTTAAATAVVKKETKTIGDHFLDHLGTVFLSSMALVILALIRSSFGTSGKTKLKSRLETEAALDPFEIQDLRLANAPDFTMEVYQTICQQLLLQCGGVDTTISYRDFTSRVKSILQTHSGTDSFTIQLGHLMDRVVFTALGTSDDDDSTTKNDYVATIPFFLVVLSLALHGSVKERIHALYHVMVLTEQQQQQSNGFNDTNDFSTTTNDNTDSFSTSDDKNKEVEVVSEEQIHNMISHLQSSCQLVPEGQVIASDTKYPIQLYQTATPQQLLTLAKVSLEFPPETPKQQWTCGDFHHLLRSQHVCAWGECYTKTKNI